MVSDIDPAQTTEQFVESLQQHDAVVSRRASCRSVHRTGLGNGMFRLWLDFEQARTAQKDVVGVRPKDIWGKEAALESLMEGEPVIVRFDEIAWVSRAQTSDHYDYEMYCQLATVLRQEELPNG
jgi:hypothetical protein